MSYFDEIYEIAIENYGIVTTAQANSVGAANKDLLRYVKDGRLIRVGRGVYQITRYIPVGNDPYAQAVALVGEGAYLYGESVIALHDLAPVNPARMFVATSKRVRKRLPVEIHVVTLPASDEVERFEGIPAQRVESAINACMKTMMPERLAAAIKKAYKLGLIDSKCKRRLAQRLEELNAQTEQ